MPDETEVSVSVLEGAELSRRMDSKKPEMEKPLFAVATHPIVVLESQFVKVSKLETDTKGNQYYPVSLNVTFEHPTTKAPFNERYNGGRLYVHDNGPERFWVGPKSKLGILKVKVEETYGLKDINMQEFLDALKGSKVGLITQNVSFNDKVYAKNIINYILGK